MEPGARRAGRISGRRDRQWATGQPLAGVGSTHGGSEAAGEPSPIRPARVVETLVWPVDEDEVGVPLPASPSDREWQGAQSRQGSAEQVPPGPALREMKSETARRACKSSDQGEEASSEGSGGH